MSAAREAGLAPQLTAVNHWPVAVATHAANHPEARHLCTAIDDIDPRKLYEPGQLDMLWASPECTHHSIARGGRPISDQSRATAWCVIRWADALLPPVIMVENVPEFATWGPLDSKFRPIEKRKGELFHAWLRNLEALGYRTDWRILCAADYGDPTTRKRLFVQAVRGRRRIQWPEPSHTRAAGDLFQRPQWRAAREIIDWALPSQSIYERKKELSPKTMRRIMAGLEKFGLNKFIVELRGTSDQQLDKSHRSVESPLPTLTTSGAHHALVHPFIIPFLSERSGQAPRVHDVDEPLPTVTGQGAGGLAQPYLVKLAHTDLRSSPIDAPLPTAGAIGLVEPFLVSYYGTGGAQSIEEPLDTVTTKHRHALVRPVVEIQGQRYQLDIRFRMLQPRELAQAQGFPADYQFTGTKTEQIKQIGNAVPCGLARALVSAVLNQSPVTA